MGRSEEVLQSVASLGLMACMADGKPDWREVECFSRAFKELFAISYRDARSLMFHALLRVRALTSETEINCACHTLNEHLSTAQRFDVFEALAEVIVADRRVTRDEKVFLESLASGLDLESLLEDRSRQGSEEWQQ